MCATGWLGLCLCGASGWLQGGSEPWLGGWRQQLAQRAARHVLHRGMRCMLLAGARWLGAPPLLAAIALHPVSQSFLAFGELTCRAVDQRNSTWFSCQARSELRTAGRYDSRPACPAVAACTTCRLVRPLSQASTRHVAALATHFNTQFNQKTPSPCPILPPRSPCRSSA